VPKPTEGMLTVKDMTLVDHHGETVATMFQDVTIRSPSMVGTKITISNSMVFN